MKKTFCSALLALSLLCPTWAQSKEPDQTFLKALRLTAAMVGQPAAQSAANALDLNFVNVTWEDTGRYKGSSVGPNISDMSLQVQSRDPGSDQLTLTLLPVLRAPNFSDKTADISLDKFFLLVGNEDGETLTKLSLREYLDHPTQYMSFPDSWKAEKKSLLAERDSHALVSAQACFLPIPKAGKVEFNPVLFNYQSAPENPAVLTILATREGTSMTIIDNSRDQFEAGRTWGQRLFFNHHGERASLTGERMSDFQANPDNHGADTTQVGEESGLNMVLLIQVPLKHKELRTEYAFAAPSTTSAASKTRGIASDIEEAVIGHGDLEGPFTEVDGLSIERDERFPVRVTVQFYQATSTGEIDRSNIQEIKTQLDRVYADGDYVGSLVVGGTTDRPTEYEGDKDMPEDWWEVFWSTHKGQFENGWTPGPDAASE